MIQKIYFSIRRRTCAGFFILAMSSLTNLTQAQGVKVFAPPSTPTEIEVQVVVIDLSRIDSSQQAFSANVAMRVSWHDPRLTNTVTEPTVMQLSQIWHPQLQVINRQRVATTMAAVAVVYPDGTVTQRQRLWGDFSQPLQLHDFPLDTQLFEIRIGTVGYGAEQISFVESEKKQSGIADNLSISDWRILGHNLDFTSYQPFDGIRPLASVAFQFKAERLRGYYLMKILLPLLLIVSMSFLVYWIPLSLTNTRISVSVTAMLTLIAYRFMIGGLLPNVSYMTRLDNFVMLSTVLVFVSLLLASVTGSCESEKPEMADRLNRYARVGFPLGLLLISFVAFGL